MPSNYLAIWIYSSFCQTTTARSLRETLQLIITIVIRNLSTGAPVRFLEFDKLRQFTRVKLSLKAGLLPLEWSRYLRIFIVADEAKTMKRTQNMSTTILSSTLHLTLHPVRHRSSMLKVPFQMLIPGNRSACVAYLVAHAAWVNSLARKRSLRHSLS